MRKVSCSVLLVVLLAGLGCGDGTPATVKVDKDLIDKQNAAQKQADSDEREMQKQQKGKK